MAAQSGRYFSAGVAGLVVNVITREQLQAMSDDKVNSALHALVVCRGQAGSQVASVFVPEYCEEYNVVMPLAFERRISVDWFIDGRCMAYFEGVKSDLHYESVNPLRAIACCLILVLQEK